MKKIEIIKKNKSFAFVTPGVRIKHCSECAVKHRCALTKLELSIEECGHNNFLETPIALLLTKRF